MQKIPDTRNVCVNCSSELFSASLLIFSPYVVVLLQWESIVFSLPPEETKMSHLLVEFDRSRTIGLMKQSQSYYARDLARRREGLIAMFLKYVHLPEQRIQSIAFGSETEATEECKRIFLYGWLSPQAVFTATSISRHEDTVRAITGHGDCDGACGNWWLKMSAGLPICIFLGEPLCLFDADSCARSLRPNRAQRDYLNKWLESIAGSGRRPFF